MNRHAVAMMFVHLSVHLLSFWDGLHCEHMVHFSADLSLGLNSSMLAPWHQSMSTYSQPSFSSSTWKRCGVWINGNWAWYLKNSWR